MWVLSKGSRCLYICMCVCLFERVPCVGGCWQKPEEKRRSPGTVVTGGFEVRVLGALSETAELVKCLLHKRIGVRST